MPHRHQLVRADGNGDIGFGGNVSEQTAAAVLHAVHVRQSMLAVHVVHDVEVTHLVVGSATGKKEKEYPSHVHQHEISASPYSMIKSTFERGLFFTLWNLISSECHVSHFLQDVCTLIWKDYTVFY